VAQSVRAGGALVAHVTDADVQVGQCVVVQRRLNGGARSLQAGGTKLNFIVKVRVRNALQVSGTTALEEQRLVAQAIKNRLLGNDNSVSSFAQLCADTLQQAGVPTVGTGDAQVGVQPTFVACNSGHVLKSGVCVRCAAGRFSSSTSNEFCTQCGDGKTSAPGATACVGCPSGKYARLTNGTAASQEIVTTVTCSQCEAGLGLNESGMCEPCKKMTYSEGGGSCKACFVGEFTIEEGGTHCASCMEWNKGAFNSGTNCTVAIVAGVILFCMVGLNIYLLKRCYRKIQKRRKQAMLLDKETRVYARNGQFLHPLHDDDDDDDDNNGSGGAGKGGDGEALDNPLRTSDASATSQKSGGLRMSDLTESKVIGAAAI
jgi:hypothetical protein